MENRQIELQVRHDLQRTQTAQIQSALRLPLNRSGATRVFGQIAIFLALPAFSLLVADGVPALTSFLLFIVTGFLMATRLRALALLLHDTVHYALCESRELNRFLGRVCSLFNFVSFETYTHRHLNHHRFMGNQSHDTDFGYGIQDTLAKILSSPKLITQLWKTLLIQFISSIQIDLLKSREPRLWKITRVGTFLLALSLAYFAGSFAAMIGLVVLPVFLFFPALQIFGDFMEHGHLAFKDRGLRSRNHAGVHWTIDWILFSNNDQYHLVHHLFPSAPGHALARIHEHLLEQSNAYRTSTLEAETRQASGL